MLFYLIRIPLSKFFDLPRRQQNSNFVTFGQNSLKSVNSLRLGRCNWKQPHPFEHWSASTAKSIAIVLLSILLFYCVTVNFKPLLSYDFHKWSQYLTKLVKPRFPVVTSFRVFIKISTSNSFTIAILSLLYYWRESKTKIGSVFTAVLKNFPSQICSSQKSSLSGEDVSK